MTIKPKPLTRSEEKVLLDLAVGRCRDIANQYSRDWKPIDPSWPTVTGCAYIRLSTETQCLVEDGSLIQQVHIVVQEMSRRSYQDKVNYRIDKFYVDAALSGQLDDRPEFLLMESNIKKKRHGFVIIKELPRISRNAVRFKRFFQTAHAAECTMVIPGFPINPNDPASVLQLDIMASVSEYEAKNTAKRVRENVHSAMINSGKFNSTHRVLGLDQVVIGEVPKVGLYQANKEELKVVEWIMATFVRLGSQQITLVEIEKRGILNKGERPFKKNSLHTLLTNMKYIGKWEVNRKNRDRDQRKLMPYERYSMVDLPHGCVIDMSLWNQVQETFTRLKGSKDKNRLERVYLLSRLLKYVDGTAFGGSGSWGKSKTRRTNYYMNSTHRFRLSADAVELEARKIATEIIKQSPKLQTAIVERTKSIRSSLDLLQGQVQIIDAKIAKVHADRVIVDKRLDFLLSTDDSTQADSFRAEYVESVNKLKGELEELQRQRAALERGKADLQDDELNTGTLIARAEKIQAMIQERDPVALKNAYKALFSEIVVGELDKNGRRELRFRIKGSDPLEGVVSGGTKIGIDEELAPRIRLWVRSSPPAV